ncbi:unnamed protein product [Arabidopsis halleri]
MAMKQNIKKLEDKLEKVGSYKRLVAKISLMVRMIFVESLKEQETLIPLKEHAAREKVAELIKSAMNSEKSLRLVDCTHKAYGTVHLVDPDKLQATLMDNNLNEDEKCS